MWSKGSKAGGPSAGGQPACSPTRSGNDGKLHAKSPLPLLIFCTTAPHPLRMPSPFPPIMDDQKRELFRLSQDARSLSYSPYSKFRVGCAFLMSSGEYIQGANLENASYGGCICAERSAMCKALLEKKRDFVALAVAADIDGPCSPCGICRQFIRGGPSSLSFSSAGSTSDTFLHPYPPLLPLYSEFCPLSVRGDA